jgi:hypothetical protein
MKTLISLFCLPLLFPLVQTPERQSISAFALQWSVPNASDWSVENGILRLIKPGVPPEVYPRRPTRIALLESKPYIAVTVEAEIKRNGRSLILVYAWQDDTHYNYVHISSDKASEVNVHNGVFHVFGGERVRISPVDGPASLMDQEWTPVKLVFDGGSGRCYVEVRGMRNPSMEAVDLSLRWGRIGVGSFDETGDFRYVRVTGKFREAGGIGTM